jgi:hypothetical protein
MSWEREPLWTKAKLYFEYAFNETHDDPKFGLWCSLGLEILARAAIASKNPALLAEPASDHRYLLHALGLSVERSPKSININIVFTLCKMLFSEFSDEHFKIAMSLANRRNEELHSGAAVFVEYKTEQWLDGFYSVCKVLAMAMGETLVSLFGGQEAKIAEETILDKKKDVKKEVMKLIQAHKTIFGSKSEDERILAAKKSEESGDLLSHERHHRVKCPACDCVATEQGEVFGKEHVSHEEDCILVKRDIKPTNFYCSACGLKLEGYAKLDAAGLGRYYSRQTTYSPEEYYGLISEEELQLRIDEYIADQGQEYDNE